MPRRSDALRRVLARRGPVYATLTVVALALRLGWVLVVDRDGFPFNDTLHYHVIAGTLADGNGFESLAGPTARWPPGYPFVLAGVYVTFGSNPLAGEVLNAVIGAATVALLMVLVERAIDWTTAVVAGAIWTVLPGPILWTDLLLSETLFIALFVGFYVLVLRARPTWGWMAVLGLAVGLGALVRGEALTWALLPVVAFWSEIPKVELAKRVGVVAMTALLVLVPWTVRNAVVMDAFVPVASNASQTLWAGHNPDATGAQVYPPPGYQARFSSDPKQQELEMANAMRDDALEYMTTHPVRELELIPLKLLHLNRGDSYALEWVNQVRDGESPPISPIDAERIGIVADAAYYALLTLTVLAAFVLGRSFWGARLGRCMATSFITALVLYGFVYYGNYRYRLPYEPLMVIAAGVVLTRLWRVRTRVGWLSDD